MGAEGLLGLPAERDVKLALKREGGMKYRGSGERETTTMHLSSSFSGDEFCLIQTSTPAAKDHMSGERRSKDAGQTIGRNAGFAMLCFRDRERSMCFCSVSTQAQRSPFHPPEFFKDNSGGLQGLPFKSQPVCSETAKLEINPLYWHIVNPWQAQGSPVHPPVNILGGLPVHRTLDGRAEKEWLGLGARLLQR